MASADFPTVEIGGISPGKNALLPGIPRPRDRIYLHDLNQWTSLCCASSSAVSTFYAILVHQLADFL